MDRMLAERPLAVPVMIVHGLWDQEDIHGPRRLRGARAEGRRERQGLPRHGPWSHGQQIDDGSALGAIRFDADTALTFRRDVLRPFLEQHLKDGAPTSGVAPVTAFETGTNTWRRLSAWPSGCDHGCRSVPRRSTSAGGQAGFEPPPTGDAPYEEWVSDPAKPVPYRPARCGRPTTRTAQLGPLARRRPAGRRSRTDVVTFVSEPLTAP